MPQHPRAFTNLRNPNTFGVPIYERLGAHRPHTRRLLERKAAWRSRQRAGVYVETSHAFLKAHSDLVDDYFEDVRYLRLIRNPLEVARSAANREMAIHRVRNPFRYYRAPDGRRYFRWSLTGREPVFDRFGDRPLSLFQK